MKASIHNQIKFIQSLLSVKTLCHRESHLALLLMIFKMGFFFFIVVLRLQQIWVKAMEISHTPLISIVLKEAIHTSKFHFYIVCDNSTNLEPFPPLSPV